MLNKAEPVLLVLGACNGRHVTGTTRLTKLVFLSEREALASRGDMKERFRFAPDKFGPLTTGMYGQAGFLGSVGMLAKDGKRFQIADKGRRFLGARTHRGAPPRIARGTTGLKKKYGRLELDGLLARACAACPDYAIRSGMRDSVATAGGGVTRTEPSRLAAPGTVFLGCALFLLRKAQSKAGKPDELLETSYACTRKHGLDPILHKALGGKKDGHKPNEHFATPEAVIEMHRYRTRLFGFIEASCGKGGALLPLQMAGRPALPAGASAVTIGVALEYVEGNGALDEHAGVMRPAGVAMLSVGAVIAVGTMARHGRANARSRADLRRLAGGLRA